MPSIGRTGLKQQRVVSGDETWTTCDARSGNAAGSAFHSRHTSEASGGATKNLVILVQRKKYGFDEEVAT